jgi:hypothetical protein
MAEDHNLALNFAPEGSLQYQKASLTNKGKKGSDKGLKRSSTFNAAQNLSGIDKYLIFFYRGYRGQYYYWEILVFAERFSLTFLAVFTQFLNKPAKSAILILYLLLDMELNFRCNPYQNSILNILKNTSLVLVFVTANIGILMWSSPEWSTFYIIIVVAVNGMFVLAWVMAVVMYLYAKKAKIIHPIMNKVVGKKSLERNLFFRTFSARKRCYLINLIFISPHVFTEATEDASRGGGGAENVSFADTESIRDKSMISYKLDSRKIYIFP